MADGLNGQSMQPGTRADKSDRTPRDDRDGERDMEGSPDRIQAPSEVTDPPPLEDDFSDPETRREIQRRARDI